MNTNPDAAILFDHVSFSYEKLLILDRVSFSIKKGSFVGIIGPNGGGKTTLLKLLLGILAPQKGSIKILNLPPRKICPKIGYVPQSHSMDASFPLTTLDLVLLAGFTGIGLCPKETKEKALKLLDNLHLLEQKNTRIGDLSGGQMQKALIARALIQDPEILVLDEPTAHVDSSSEKFLLKFLLSLKKEKTILMVTHNIQTILQSLDLVLSVQKSVTLHNPEKLCEHFAWGLYHEPLIHSHPKPQS
jgi:zinc transport system ATP-binding protein